MNTEITRKLGVVNQSGLSEFQKAGLETYLRAVMGFIDQIIKNNNILGGIQSAEQTNEIQEYENNLVLTVEAVKRVENAMARNRILEMREAGELIDLHPVITSMLLNQSYAKQAVMLARTPTEILEPIMQKLENKGGGLKLDFLMIELQLSNVGKDQNKPRKS